MIPQKYLDACLRLQREFELDPKSRRVEKTPEFYKKVLPNTIDPVEVFRVLESQGLLTAEKHGNEIFNMRLTNAGFCYFENRASEKSQRNAEHRHDWLLAIFQVFLGALLSRPLWAGITYVWELLKLKIGA